MEYQVYHQGHGIRGKLQVSNGYGALVNAVLIMAELLCRSAPAIN